MPAHSLALFAPWFGPWPVWINLHLESCRHNPWVTWIIPTDQDPPENQPLNVRFLPMTLTEFTARAAAVTGLQLNPENVYKICDYKPLIGELFPDEIAGFTHFGYTDNDTIYGQLSCELTPERLARYEIISGHGNMQAGHLTVLQNTPRLRRAWRRMPGWRRRVGAPEHRYFDEIGFGKHINPNTWHPPWRRYKVLWTEMYSMPDRARTWSDGGPNPTRLHWQNGVLTDPRNAQPQYAYLHFMLWRSSQYRAKGVIAPWEALDSILHVDWRDAAANGFDISTRGFWPLNQG